MFMTATMIHQSEQARDQDDARHLHSRGQRLVTVRYAEPRAFAIYAARCNRSEADLRSGAVVLIGLLETIIDRLADFIERIQAEVDVPVALGVRNQRRRRHAAAPLRRAAASRSGARARVTSKARESAHSLGRLLTFFAHAVQERKEGKALQSRIRTAARDVNSLTDHVSFLSEQDHLPARRHARHDQHPAGRHHQDLLGCRRGVPAADADRLDLWHEFPPYAGARLVVRLSARARAHGAVRPFCPISISSAEAGCSWGLHCGTSACHTGCVMISRIKER